MIGFSKSAQLGKPVKDKKTDPKVKAVQQWAMDRARLKVIYESKKIDKCEYVDDDGKKCGSKEWLGFAHIDKRDNLSPAEKASFYCTLLLCQHHHEQIENDKNERNRLFSLLR